jgi:hypothetical protein
MTDKPVYLSKKVRAAPPPSASASDAPLPPATVPATVAPPAPLPTATVPKAAVHLPGPGTVPASIQLPPASILKRNNIPEGMVMISKEEYARLGTRGRPTARSESRTYRTALTSRDVAPRPADPSFRAPRTTGVGQRQTVVAPAPEGDARKVHFTGLPRVPSMDEIEAPARVPGAMRWPRARDEPNWFSPDIAALKYWVLAFVPKWHHTGANDEWRELTTAHKAGCIEVAESPTEQLEVWMPYEHFKLLQACGTWERWLFSSFNIEPAPCGAREGVLGCALWDNNLGVYKWAAHAVRVNAVNFNVRRHPWYRPGMFDSCGPPFRLAKDEHGMVSVLEHLGGTKYRPEETMAALAMLELGRPPNPPTPPPILTVPAAVPVYQPPIHIPAALTGATASEFIASLHAHASSSAATVSAAAASASSSSASTAAGAPASLPSPVALGPSVPVPVVTHAGTRFMAPVPMSTIAPPPPRGPPPVSSVIWRPPGPVSIFDDAMWSLPATAAALAAMPLQPSAAAPSPPSLQPLTSMEEALRAARVEFPGNFRNDGKWHFSPAEHAGMVADPRCCQWLASKFGKWVVDPPLPIPPPPARPLPQAESHVNDSAATARVSVLDGNVRLWKATYASASSGESISEVLTITFLDEKRAILPLDSLLSLQARGCAADRLVDAKLTTLSVGSLDVNIPVVGILGHEIKYDGGKFTLPCVTFSSPFHGVKHLQGVRASSSDALFVSRQPSSSQLTVQSCHIEPYGADGDFRIASSCAKDGSFSLPGALMVRHNANSEPGNCGSPLITGTSCDIAGIHVSSGSDHHNMAFSVV